LGLFFFFSFIFAVLGLELRTFTLSRSTSPDFFGEGFFKIGFRELFACAGFELQFSRALPPE
jgi:hypothetical protein